jgi:GR25 family glycosyltransferase involved in LPS biosynthesis
MLELTNITLIAVATRQVEETVTALIQSSNGIKWGSVKIVSHYKPENLPEFITYEPVHKMTDIDDWNNYIFYHLWKHVDTPYCMLIHYDGYVINPGSWKEEFLEYDFIGAPWPEPSDPGHMRDKNGNQVRVGNSVSIRSRKLLMIPREKDVIWKKFEGNYNEDSQICVHNRHIFEEDGCRFAPLEVAKYFSHEVPIPETEGIIPFAFHKYEAPAPPKKEFSLLDMYAAYINLDSRPDRNERMVNELTRVGIKADRLKGLLPEEVEEPEHKISVMLNRTPGAIGCHYSQVAVMKEALSRNSHAFVMEDDLIFCDDIQERLKHIEEFLSHREWDVFWLGGTYHKKPTWHKSVNGKHTHPDLQMCTCNLNRDWEPTEDPKIVRTYGCWSTYAYIVNRKRLAHILDLLDQNVYMSMGIDWLFIKLQPQLNTYAYVPGCVKQYDNRSNIGNGITEFSTFASLGEYWFQPTAEGFDYSSFYQKPR